MAVGSAQRGCRCHRPTRRNTSGCPSSSVSHRRCCRVVCTSAVPLLMKMAPNNSADKCHPPAATGSAADLEHDNIPIKLSTAHWQFSANRPPIATNRSAGHQPLIARQMRATKRSFRPICQLAFVASDEMRQFNQRRSLRFRLPMKQQTSDAPTFIERVSSHCISSQHGNVSNSKVCK